MSVFGIWPIFEMHRGMWPGYSFSRFQERFWHFAHFVITQRHVVRSYIFSFSRASLAFGPFSKYTEACGPIIFFLVFISVFFCICWLQIVLAFCPFSKCTGGMCSGHIFSRFYARPQKSYPSKSQKCCPTKIKKQDKKKFSFPAIEKRLDFNKKRV